MRRTGSWLLPVALLLAALAIGGCGEDKNPTGGTISPDELAIRGLFSSLASRCEAHDLDGFMAFIDPDYLQNGQDRDGLLAALADPLEGWAWIKTSTIRVDSVAITGNQALAFLRVTFGSTTGESRIVVEPDSWSPLGFGWLIRSGDRWLVCGDQKVCSARVGVVHSDQASPDDYALSLSIDSPLLRAATKAEPTVPPYAIVTGPNIPETWIYNRSGVVVTPSQPPRIGDSYTFFVNRDGGNSDTLFEPVRGRITILPAFEVTAGAPGSGTLEFTWSNVSAQVADPSAWRIYVKSPLDPDPYSTDDLPLTRTSHTFSGLLSGRTYNCSVRLYDIYGDYAYTTRSIAAP